MDDQPQPLPLPPSRHHIRHIARRTLSKSWDDSIFSESAQAAFWCALSLPPLLLGMLGSLAYVAPLFGPETLPAIQEQLISTAARFFSSNVVNEIIAADSAGHREGRQGRSGVDRFRDLAVGGLVGHLVIRRLGGRGPRPDAAAPSGAAAVLRARPVRGGARGGDRGGTVGGARSPQDRRASARQLGQRTGVRLLPGADSSRCSSG